MPVYTVPNGQPTVPVALPAGKDPALAQAFRTVPLPGTAQPAAGGDAEAVVWQPSTDTMWEFWELSKTSSGWQASWGGVMHNVSTNPGYYTSPSDWGASATSLPVLGGLIRPSELAAGHIDHAIAMAIPDTRAGAFAWPAQRTDGNTNSSTAIPEGQRFRLDPSLNLATFR